MPSRRRRRSDSHDDKSSESDESSVTSSASKRVRTNRPYQASNTSSQSPVPSGPNTGRSLQINKKPNISTTADSEDYQPGAIVRVKVTNFITYENAVFYPGPHLNMVIGPNGTGKSSLVCAICLGLGWSPKHLGRAGNVSEFVKHGSNEADIEIELKGRPEDDDNITVRVRITREDNGRIWWLNGRVVTHKAIQTAAKELNVQIDNLCQFLPQDKVAEFAALKPEELLRETQRAAAPETMLQWHDSLKRLRGEQKALQDEHVSNEENFARMETRQQGLHSVVERMNEREQIKDKISVLERSKPFVHYRAARSLHMEQKQKKIDATNRLKELEREVEPTLRAVNSKQQYRDQVGVVVKARGTAVGLAERAADSVMSKLEDVDNSLKEKEASRTAERNQDASRKSDLQRIQVKIRNLENQLKDAPPTFDAPEFNKHIVS